MNHWIRPSCDSRTGASHLRRGVPCQDACGSVGFRDAAGLPIQVLVVSDGHGGSRYVRSDVGARLACTVAMRELEQALAPARVVHPGALQDWRDWLAGELPARIVAAWLQEVEGHWRVDPHAVGAGFSPVLYGATLGVLVLTPLWWAHTGLGDWDLVRIEAAGGEGAAGEMAGGEVLVSEEPEREAGGEATFSLCLEGAERHFAPRTAFHPLTAEDPPFELLLATDGLRKSCGSDADFLTLCRYLSGLAPSGHPPGRTELAEALDHISRQGSGDDISVAVGCWAPVEQGAAWPAPGRSEPARLLQPLTGPASGASQPAVEITGARLAGMEAAMVPALDSPLEPPTPSVEPVAPALADSSLIQAAASSLLSPRPASTSRRSGGRLVLAAAGLVLGGAVLLVAAGRAPGLFAARPRPSPLVLTPQQSSDLRRQVQDLCQPPATGPGAQDRAGRSLPPGAPPVVPPAVAAAGPASQSPQGSPTALPATAPPALDPRRQQRIGAILATRASVFRSLRDGDPAQAAALMAGSHVDPLSALIAASASDASLRPAASPADPPGPLQRPRRIAALSPWAEPSRRPSAPASPLAGLGACPELRQALRASWQRLEIADAAPAGLRHDRHRPRPAERR